MTEHAVKPGKQVSKQVS